MNPPFNTIDYINNSFMYPTLTKIHGYPTFVTLQKLKNQLKSNARAVSSDIGDGAHGHLGLVLTPQEYASVSDTPYELSAHPGVFNIPRNADVAEAVRRREAYKEHMRNFAKMWIFEKLLSGKLLRRLKGNILTNSVATLQTPLIKPFRKY